MNERPRFCYLILAHTDPDGALRLVRRIRTLSPTAHVVVRHDDPAYVDPSVLREAGALPLVSRTRVRWGDWSLVEAMLEAMEFGRSMTDAEYFVLISGQDYPVLDLAAWEDELVSRGPDAVLDPHPGQPRNWRYRWSSPTLRRTGVAPLDRAVRFAACRVGDVTDGVIPMHTSPRAGDDRLFVGVRRASPPPVTVTKCSQWMTLSRLAVDAVLERDRCDRRTRTFFQHTQIPDESYVQSLLHDDPRLIVMHTDTSAKNFEPGAPNPTWLDPGQLDYLIRRSAAPFVRKIPVNVDPQVVERADTLATRSPEQARLDATLQGRQADHRTWVDRIRATLVRVRGEEEDERARPEAEPARGR